MRDERFEVRVSFDERRGYVAHANGLPTITALSLAVARRRIKLATPPRPHRARR
jgi:hypothetical protein